MYLSLSQFNATGRIKLLNVSQKQNVSATGKIMQKKMAQSLYLTPLSGSCSLSTIFYIVILFLFLIVWKGLLSSFFSWVLLVK